MEKKKIIIILLFIIILGISSYGVFFQGEKDEVETKKINFKNINEEITEIDITDILLRIKDKKDYFKNKKINYPLMLFFNNVNSKQFEEIEVYPEYKAFIGDSLSEYFSFKYDKDGPLFYEIIDINKKDDKYIVKIKYKVEKNEKISYATFSTDGRYVLDKPFLKIVNINQQTTKENVEVFIESKAVFEDGEMYKIKVKNNGSSDFIINDGQYGFYAIKNNNKYSHKLLNGTINDYKVYPHTEKNLYVIFENLRNPEKINIVLKEGEQFNILD